MRPFSNKPIFYFLIVLIASCQEAEIPPRNVSFDEIAGNEAVKAYMLTFEGMGAMADSTSLPEPATALKSFSFPADLELELLLAEPQVHQPVELNFDHRGRLWVVQYNQYPYPQGVKVKDIDNHARVVFDKMPDPPGEGIKGADKISFFEDTDGDGKYDRATDAITGLNITTGVTFGREKIWVLTPPYLVAYPDPDGDGLPDGAPLVHLEGFGLEDTHAVANSLRWGPDGWLYGAQGSTTIANINSGASKNVHFKGQAIWRYHPDTQVFEVFAEGGGNTFDTEFDAKGRLFSGDNGTARGFYYKQGGYYQKNWGKHGALTNPYAFGYLPGMGLDGKKMRFTHAWIRYEGGTLPAHYHDKIFALNPLHNFVQLTRLETQGSTFLCIDEEKVLETEDHWFRPVDIKAGPDGAIYIADWSDSRLSHVNPLDNWNKRSGRIYRLHNGQPAAKASFDLSQYTHEQLIALLKSENKWFRQQALRIMGDRKDATVLPLLYPLFRSADGQTALEALWAIHLSGGWSEAIALEAMNHGDPYVRLWAIRLTGDTHQASKKTARKLIQLAGQEKHPEVIGQLASSAKRLPPQVAVPMILHLLKNENTAQDPDNLHLIWWAVESKAETGRVALLTLFEDPELWEKRIVKDMILERWMHRYILAGGKQNYLAATTLLQQAPTDKDAKILMIGLEEGLRGRALSELPSQLTDQIRHYQSKFGAGKLTMALRQHEASAITEALRMIADGQANRLEKLSYIQIFGEINEPACIPVLLQIAAEPTAAVALRLACLKSLQHYNDDTIGAELAKAYAFKLRADPDVRLAAFQLFASRAHWAIDFLKLITEQRAVKKSEVPPMIIRQFKLNGDPQLDRLLNELWPEVKLATSDEKTAAVLKIKTALQTGAGDAQAGKPIYQRACGACHRLQDMGGSIGPDLTGYDRSNLNYLVLNIVDPNADIREGYVTYTVEKNDGQVIVGTIVDRSDAVVSIRTLSGEESTLAQREIKTMTAQKTSIMPEKIMEPLSDQEIRDLFAYLQQADF